MNKQPVELLDKVMKELSIDDAQGVQALRQCCEVSKHLRKIALPHAWKSIRCLPPAGGSLETFREFDTSFPWENHNKFFFATPAISCHVKKLTVVGVHPEYFLHPKHHYHKHAFSYVSIHAIHNLISAFPNLKHLSVQRVVLKPWLHSSHEDYLPAVLQLPSIQKLSLHEVRLPELPIDSISFLQIPSITSQLYIRCTWSLDDPTLAPDFSDIISPSASLQSHVSYNITRSHMEYMTKMEGLKTLQVYKEMVTNPEKLQAVINTNAGTLETVLLQICKLSLWHLKSSFDDGIVGDSSEQPCLSECLKLKEFTLALWPCINETCGKYFREMFQGLFLQLPKNLQRIRILLFWGLDIWST